MTRHGTFDSGRRAPMWPALAVWLVFVLICVTIIARTDFKTDFSAFLPSHPTPEQQLLVEQLKSGAGSSLLLIGIEAGARADGSGYTGGVGGASDAGGVGDGGAGRPGGTAGLGRAGSAGAPASLDDSAATSARLAALSRTLAARLREDDAFKSVLNGEPVAGDADQKLLFEHRYLLSPQVTPEHFTVGGLRAAAEDSIADIASSTGLMVKDLLPRDPTGETLALVDRMLPTSGGPRTIDGHWFNDQGTTALLLVQTRASGDDIDGQEQAIRRIQAAFREMLSKERSLGPAGSREKEEKAPNGPLSAQTPTLAPGDAAQHVAGVGPLSAQTQTLAPELLISGPGKFAVASRESIKSAVERLSLVGSLLILSLLYTVYRSVAALFLGVLPVITGVLAGIAAVSVGFGSVHGITLGFGATLVGEAVDYAIYLFVQRGGAGGSRTPGSQAGYSRNFWPTIRLGVLTSVCGFSALLLSGFPGLAQLGAFSIAGIVSAAVVTRWLLPKLLPESFSVRNTAALGARLARLIDRARVLRWPALALALAAVLLLAAPHDRLWNHELLALSPVPIEAQALDARLRAAMGAPDLRYLIVIRGTDAQDALKRCERLQPALDRAVEDGVLGGYEAPCNYLPSVATQLKRRAALPPDAELRDRMTQALAGLALKLATVEPFFTDVAAARQSQPLTLADVQDASFAAALDATLKEVPTDAASGSNTHWNALVQLRGPAKTARTTGIDIAELKRRTGPLLDAQTVLLDLKGASDALYGDYLSQAMRLSGLGLVAILIVLSASLRSVRRVAVVCLPLFAAVTLVAAGLHLAGVRMNLLHLVGLLLIVAVGSNYALFFDSQSQPEAKDERIYASLLFASMTTVVGFGVLAFSDVPVLAAIGMTVGPGAVCALVFSAILSRNPALSAQRRS